MESVLREGFLVFVFLMCNCFTGFPGGSVVKNLPADEGDTGLIPGPGSSPGEEMATHSRILAWEIPWTEEPAGLHGITKQSDTT